MLRHHHVTHVYCKWTHEKQIKTHDKVTQQVTHTDAVCNFQTHQYRSSKLTKRLVMQMGEFSGYHVRKGHRNSNTAWKTQSNQNMKVFDQCQPSRISPIPLLLCKQVHLSLCSTVTDSTLLARVQQGSADDEQTLALYRGKFQNTPHNFVTFCLNYSSNHEFTHRQFSAYISSYSCGDICTQLMNANVF